MTYAAFTRSMLVVATVLMLPATARAVNPSGRLDSCDAEYARGWARDTDAPGGQVYVHVYLDAPRGSGGVFIGQLFANLPYPGQGNYGFAFPIPPSAHSGPSQRKIYVYAINVGSGNDRQLNGSGMLMGDVLYLDNGTVKVGMKLTWGGVISELWYDSAQLIDNFDPGLEIQAAYYAGGDHYSSTGDWNDPNWGWNPVQGGDKYDRGSGIVTYVRSPNSVYIRTSPLEWNPDNKGGGPGQSVRSTVTLEQWVTISGRVVYLDYGLQNDGTPRAAHDQEVPVIFPNENFNDLVAYYSGINPWAGEPMTTALPLPSPGTTYTNRESMFFMGNSAGTNGITLLDLDDINFTARTEPWFGYVRCDKEFAIPANAYILRNAVVIPGDYTSARTIAYGLGIGRREWGFETAGNTENWLHSPDMAPPIVSGGALSGQSNGAQSSLTSPDVNLFAAVQPRIEARMSATAGASAKMYFTTDFDPSWTEDKSITVAITSDGLYRTVFFATAAHSRWAGRIRQLRFHPIDAAGTFSVDYLRVVHTGGRQWLWNTDGNTEGWTAVNDISGFGVAGGVLRGTATGPDPYMHVGLSVETGAVPQVELRLKSSGPWAELYWVTDVEPSFDENKKMNFVLESDGQFHTYLVPINLNWRWQGTATRFRLDPSTLSPGASFEVDYLRLASPTGAVWNFGDEGNGEDWNGINTANVTVSGGSLNFTATNADPYFIQGSSDGYLNADLFKRLRVTMRTGAAGAFQVYFNRFGDPPAFSETRKTSFTLVADGTMRTYTFDMGTHPSWNGVMRDLRIDPLSAAGTASIDSVEFLP